MADISNHEDDSLECTLEERNRILTDYLPLVRKIARRRKYSPLGEDDLVQEGVIGLAEALKRFDPERSSLLTYGPYDIMDRMRRAEWKARWIRPGFKAYARGGEYAYQNVTTGWESIDKTPASSSDDADALMDLSNALRHLPTREQFVLREYFWNDSTQAQIAANLGVSIPIVSKLKNRALDKLRRLLV